MTKMCEFFATKNDLTQIINEVEASVEVHYILGGQFDKKIVMEYSSLLDIKDLGISTTGNAILCDSYLILPKKQGPKIKRVFLKKGGLQYAIYDGDNPNSISIRIGGIFQNKFLIASSIGAINTSNISNEIYRKFTRPFIKKIKKVQSYHVGEEALQMLHSGYRLITMSIDSPIEYDLKEN